MSNYIILDSSDVVAWNHFINKVGNADVYFTAEYCKIHENNQDGLARLFVYEEGDKIVCYPYLLRRINDLNVPNIDKFNEDLFDIVTPYGFGGPLTNVQNVIERQTLFFSFSKTFEKYCQDSKIVSEFVRFHPILKNYEYYTSVAPEYIQNTISMDLSSSEELILESLTNKSRNRLKHAIKNGLSVIKEDPNNLEILMKQYFETMKKNQANSYYFFNEDYFKDSVNLLQNHIDLFSVNFEGKTLASTLFLHYNGFVSYHLTGSDQKYLKYAPYNILIYHAACWYGKMGYKTLHLGGGYLGNDDSLFRFKKTFTKRNPLDFYVGRKVHCQEIYQLITEGSNVSEDYFPLYRHPKLTNKLIQRTT